MIQNFHLSSLKERKCNRWPDENSQKADQLFAFTFVRNEQKGMKDKMFSSKQLPSWWHRLIQHITSINNNNNDNNKTQHNSKCRLRDDRDETINHIISECSKSAQREYKARHDWVGKVIHWEMCKKFQFDHTNKWYMHNPAPVLENATHKLLWDFNIQTDHLIPARRPDLIIINKIKRTCKIIDFAVPADHRIKLKESEKKDKYLDLARELKKRWKMQVTIISNCNWCVWNSNSGITKGVEDLEVGGRVETIQTTALLRTARILRRVLETWGDLLKNLRLSLMCKALMSE